MITNKIPHANHHEGNRSAEVIWRKRRQCVREEMKHFIAKYPRDIIGNCREVISR